MREMKIGQGAIKGIFFTGSPEYYIHTHRSKPLSKVHNGQQGRERENSSKKGKE